MARRTVRPFGASIPTSRVFSLLLALLVLGMMYETMRRPETWNWIEKANGAEPDAVQAAADEPLQEVIIEGPNDLDPEEFATFERGVELITDRTELRPREMPLYWQLMGWSRSQTFAELEARAEPEPAFVQLWDETDNYRGKPIRMRMHVRRVLEFEAPENPLGAETVYEAWGWTEESKSFPYVVVFTEKPAGLPVGPEVAIDVMFVGYPLKVMSYTAFDARRGTPLLIGKVRLAQRGQGSSSAVSGQLDRWVIGGVVAALTIFAVLWFLQRRRGSRHRMPLPESIDDWTFAAQPASTETPALPQ